MRVHVLWTLSISAVVNIVALAQSHVLRALMKWASVSEARAGCGIRSRLAERYRFEELSQSIELDMAEPHRLTDPSRLLKHELWGPFAHGILDDLVFPSVSGLVQGDE